MKKILAVLAVILAFCLVGCELPNGKSYGDTNSTSTVNKQETEIAIEQDNVKQEESNKVEDESSSGLFVEEEPSSSSEDDEYGDSLFESEENVSRDTSVSSETTVTVTIQKDEGASGDMVWIPVHGGTKYHIHSECSNMRDPDHVTRDRAESLGFTPCKKCFK